MVMHLASAIQGTVVRLRGQRMFQRSAVAPVDHRLSHLAAPLQANVDEASLCLR